MTAPALPLPVVDVAVHCGECSAPMELKRGQYGLFWGCTAYPLCRGIHGAHQATGAPLGTPADAATRAARVKAHQALDRLWKSGTMSRAAAYRWLATVLELPPEEAHIAKLDAAQCARVVQAFERFKPDGIPVQERRR